MTTHVRSVSQAFSILRLLAEEARPKRLTDLARVTGLSPSSCLGILRTLVAEGAIEIDSQKRYRLSPGWARLEALTDCTEARLLAKSGPLLSRFAIENDAVTGLWRLNQRDRIELIALGESQSLTRIHMSIGQRQPLGGGGIGRALAAELGLDDTELESRFSGARWQTPLTFATYKEQVAAAANYGFAIDDGYAFAGVCSVSCVIPRATPRYLLSTSVFARTRSEPELLSLGKNLVELAKEISRLE